VVAEHLLAVIREALSNVARHALATRVDLRIWTDERGLSLTVDDDGIGPGTPAGGGRGIDNMLARARRLGGTSSLDAREGGGSRLRWDVPLPHDD
jgi:signal transduction histidine kinase